ncbi:hypothetical protein C351_04947 [Cryptococcus neoformans c8]|nr:hypothetical protein C353_05065 [Cryptococcus neoformans var. grubii AD1-83a]OXG53408.1 hypothetical protein C354_05003 [Cryptococcus neoformans var. grubii MW-RSA1955]OXG56804.1 hypothetical protein C352_04982 [Cryptococcus neoformans var. grubii CHC193]OXG60246.1 hypothetical protein C351_04947 [Cryptococcus neoformans var. grubii c8]OXH06139.1 hypothetical protein C369_05040 [Cryptococcus neoformans var. grubii A5-35-17]OXH07209.1 hypothetical protein C370_05119 [Cryptococcus neoformans 
MVYTVTSSPLSAQHGIMSLNSVVNRLVRAAAGISQDISDVELDAHVAQLLAEEAKAKELKWSELGLTGLLGNSMAAGRDSPDPLPRPNKRFLASVIRTVDGHNNALLRSQAEAAKQARNERMPGPSRTNVGSSRRITGGAAGRLFGGAVKDMARYESARTRDRRREHRGDERTVKRQDEERGEDEVGSSRYDDDHRGEKRHREDNDRRPRNVDKDSPDNTRKSRGDDYDRFDRRRGRRRDRSHERKGYGSDEDRSRGKSRRADADDDNERDRERRRRRYDRDSHSLSPSKPRHSSIKSSPAPKPPREPSPQASPQDLSSSPSPPPVSKMDKYFESSYDPRLDLPAVPAQGLVAEIGWDNMLAILKERGKKKRRNSPSLSDDEPAPPPGILPRKRAYSPDTLARKAERKGRKTAREERRKRRGDIDSEDEGDRAKRRERRKEKEKEKANGEQQGGGLLDGYEYTKKGSVREWDMGK